MAAPVRVITTDTSIIDETPILVVEIGTDRADKDRTAVLPSVVSTVRLPPVRTR